MSSKLEQPADLVFRKLSEGDAFRNRAELYAFNFRYELHIGADNHTHHIDDNYLNEIVSWSKGTFPNCHIQQGKGLFRGTLEDSVHLTVFSGDEFDTNWLQSKVRILKRKLDQEGILVTKSSSQTMEI